VKTLKALLPVTILAAAHGGVDFYGAFLQALAPVVSEHLAIQPGRIVALVGVVGLVTNGIQPLIGLIMGKRNIAWILWGALLLSMLPCFMGFIDSYWLLVILVLGGSLGTGSFHPEGILSAHDSSGEYAHFGVPLFMAGGYFFTAAGAPIAIHWVSWFGLRSLVWFILPGLLLAALLYLNLRRKKAKHPSIVLRPRSQRRTRAIPGGVSIWPLLTVAVFCNIATALFLAIITSHYELTYGPESRTWAGWVMLTIGGVGCLASFFWGHICHKKGYFLVLLLTQLASAPLFILLARADSPIAGFWYALPLSVISPGSVYPVAVTLTRNASGLTQSLRAGLIVGGTWGLAALVVMAAGVLLDMGVPSWQLVSVSGFSCLVTAVVAGVQLLRGRAARAT
jgi:Arabinose efflux permease